MCLLHSVFAMQPRIFLQSIQGSLTEGRRQMLKI